MLFVFVRFPFSRLFFIPFLLLLLRSSLPSPTYPFIVCFLCLRSPPISFSPAFLPRFHHGSFFSSFPLSFSSFLPSSFFLLLLFPSFSLRSSLHPGLYSSSSPPNPRLHPLPLLLFLSSSCLFLPLCLAHFPFYLSSPLLHLRLHLLLFYLSST